MVLLAAIALPHTAEAADFTVSVPVKLVNIPQHSWDDMHLHIRIFDEEGTVIASVLKKIPLQAGKGSFTGTLGTPFTYLSENYRNRVPVRYAVQIVARYGTLPGYNASQSNLTTQGSITQ